MRAQTPGISKRQARIAAGINTAAWCAWDFACFEAIADGSHFTYWPLAVLRQREIDAINAAIAAQTA